MRWAVLFLLIFLASFLAACTDQVEIKVDNPWESPSEKESVTYDPQDITINYPSEDSLTLIQNEPTVIKLDNGDHLLELQNVIKGNATIRINGSMVKVIAGVPLIRDSYRIDLQYAQADARPSTRSSFVLLRIDDVEQRLQIGEEKTMQVGDSAFDVRLEFIDREGGSLRAMFDINGFTIPLRKSESYDLFGDVVTLREVIYYEEEVTFRDAATIDIKSR